MKENEFWIAFWFLAFSAFVFLIGYKMRIDHVEEMKRIERGLCLQPTALGSSSTHWGICK